MSACTTILRRGPRRRIFCDAVTSSASDPSTATWWCRAARSHTSGDWSIAFADCPPDAGPLLGPHLILELIDERDRIDRTRPRRVENRLVIRPFRIHHDRDVVVAQLEDLGRKADAFGVARTGTSIDLDAIGHMMVWGSTALR